MSYLWPPKSITNELGIATVSLGEAKLHSLESKLQAASDAGFKVIDLLDQCWAEYLAANGQDPEQLWESTEENLRLARQLGDLIKSLGMRIACTQPLRQIAGHTDERERRDALDVAAKRFPFMRAFDTDLVFMCASVHEDSSSTMDYKVVAKDLAELGRMAEEYSIQDGGKLLRIGYEGLSWAERNTWSASWEVVRAANRHNVGLIVDSFNLLGVEYADPYNPEGHGRIYATEEESMDVLRMSLASFVSTVPGDRIFFVQLGDAELMDPKVFHKPEEPNAPELLPWSRKHRLYPLEHDRGAYLPVDSVTAAILATGYTGPLSLEVFAASLHQPGNHVPSEHAKRGYESLQKLVAAIPKVEQYWSEPASMSKAYKIWKSNRSAYSKVQSAKSNGS